MAVFNWRRHVSKNSGAAIGSRHWRLGRSLSHWWPPDCREHFADDVSGPLIQTSVSGELSPLTRGQLIRAFWRYPLLTWGVVFRIHLHALALWLKRVRFFHKPPPPADFVTR